MRRARRAAGRMLALALAAALACALVPAPALARTAAADLGIAIEVPASAFVDEGGGSDVRAADALVGIRVEVPRQALADEEGGSGVKAASGTVGIRLEVPAQSYVDPGDGSDVKAAEGTMGIRLQVPRQAFVEPEDGSDVKAAEGLFGIRLEVPKQAFADDSPGAGVKAADALVGIRLQVPSQAYVEDDPATTASAALLGIRLAVATTHTVTFDANGLTFDPSGVTGTTAQTVLDGACVAQPDPVAATWEGHKVVGWYTDPGCPDDALYDFAEPVYGDFTLFAKWEAVPYEKQAYRLHMGCDDAELAGTDKAAGPDADGVGWSDGSTYAGAYEVGKGLTLPGGADVSRDGYAFEGWYADADGNGEPDFDGDAVTFISREETVERDFWAKWRQLPPPEGEFWTVTFDSRGGTEVAPQTVAKPDGGFVAEPPAPTRSGFAFTGWYADSMCMREFDFSAKVTADATLYAGWERTGGAVTTTWRVDFDTQGGSRVASQTVEDGKVAKRPATDPVKNGWVFDGWRVGPGDDAAEFDFSAPIESDTTVYAKWRERQSFDVTFHAAGGAFEDAEGGVSMGEVTLKVKEGELVPLSEVPGMEGSSSPAPKRAGWQFSAWYPSLGDGSGGDYAGEPFDFEGTPISGNTDLWAGWGLRLDVTLPVSVGFAVDAGSREVTTPDANRYALKSRTVKPVTVDAVAATSEESELAEFFALPEGEAWGPMLQGTALSLRARDAGPEVSIALAGDAAAEAGEGGRVWKNARTLGPDEREAFTIGAFDYGGTSFDESWQGADPSSSLPVKLGMTVPESLGVRTDLDGPQKITRLTLTVSARG